jgi:hypothetical protein
VLVLVVVVLEELHLQRQLRLPRLALYHFNRLLLVVVVGMPVPLVVVRVEA